MASFTWDQLKAEDVDTTPEKLLDMLIRMRKEVESEALACYPMQPYFKNLLDRKITQIKSDVVV